jgi:putative nucleotidyltransferase with HDIG domain
LGQVQTIAADASAAGQAMPLAEVLAAFSYALDITEGQPEGHCVRASWIAGHVGRAIGLAGHDLAELHYATLLKDLGCSSNAARLSELYRTDDRAFKHEFKTMGASVPGALRFLFAHVGSSEPILRRVGAIAQVLRKAGTIADEMIATRCTRGADIARQLRFSERVAEGIYALDELWDGSGRPRGLAGEAIPLFARIALLAQVAEVFHARGGAIAARTEVRRRAGRWFDPALVAAFLKVSEGEAFWHDLASPTIDQKVLALSFDGDIVLVDEDYLDDIAAAFGGVVDAKSPYTGGHSQRVADYAVAIATRIGFDKDRLRWLRRGALLHDIGKLGVSNAILDKPAKLDDAEWTTMRGHAGHTQAILSRLSAFRDLAPIAAAHHERLDGTGYPLRLSGDAICQATRIITIADFFDALVADRPYRAAIPVDQALAIIEGEVGKAIDPYCFTALRDLAAEGRLALA